MFAASRRALLYWVLLLLPTISVGAGAILLLWREQGRLQEQSAGAEAARKAAFAARTRLIAENVELLVGDAQTGLLDTLASEPAEGVDSLLDSWEKNNPLVRIGFRASSTGALVRPARTAGGAEEAGFARRWASRQFGGSPPWGAGEKEEMDAVDKRQAEEAPERKDVARNFSNVQSARQAVQEIAQQRAIPPMADDATADRVGALSAAAAAAPSTRSRDEAAPAAAGVKVASKAKDVSADRRGWTAFQSDGRLHMLGWVQPGGTGEVRGVELELVGLVRLLEGALPVETSLGEGYALRDDQKRIVHQVGTAPSVATPLVTVPLAASVLPGWEAVAFWQPSRTAGGSGFIFAGSLLVAIFVVVVAVSGYVLLWQAQRSDAEAALKTSFVANVSHEFKTPLTTIRLYSELLEQGRVKDAAQEHEYLRTISRETQRLARLVNNVLDFSRLEQGRKKYEKQSIDLVPELSRLLETQKPRLADAGIELKKDLPASASVTTDRDAVQQIVLNLIDNAAKYAAEGKEVLVSLTSRSGGGVALKVADRGPGVPESHRDRVFDKFYRVDDTLTSDRGGAGLGLSIARQLARGLGGDLRCEAREGGGAAFILELP